MARQLNAVLTDLEATPKALAPLGHLLCLPMNLSSRWFPRRSPVLTALVLAFPGWMRSDDPPAFPPTPLPLQLEDEDVFLFLGDSITHQALYTQFLETHFLACHPNTDLVFWNSGVGGDRAAHALARFEEDVASRKPTHVSVLLGMNDASYTAWKDQVFATYETDMTRLIERLEATTLSVSLLHPTIFDSRAARLKGEAPEPTATRYNAALAYFGEWGREIAIQRGHRFVDLHAPLNRYTAMMRRENPRFTFIPDAVHPDANGQLVMAVTILDELFDAGGPTSEIRLTRSREDGSVRSSVQGGKITTLEADADGKGLSFTFAADRLPWVVPDAAAMAFDLLEIDSRFNTETLRIRGLAPGAYRLAIDDREIGTWSAETLAEGIDLAGNENTPGYRRARELAEANADRNARLVVSWRNWWRDRKIRDHALATAISDDPDQKAALELAHTTWMEAEFVPQEAAAAKSVQDAWESLQEVARQPRNWRYSLQPVAEPRENAAAP